MLETKNLPRPGTRKMTSTKMVPVIRLGICGPRMVMSGMSAFLRACRSTTSVSVRPLARAVRMYSACITSTRLERV